MSGFQPPALRMRIAVLALLAACATPSPPSVEPEPAAPDAAVLQGQVAPGPEPPPEVRESLLPSLGLGSAPQPESSPPRFDLSVREVPAKEFFMGLVEDTPYSMVVDPGVDGTISLTLKNATIADVMEAVQDVYDYDYERTSYGYHVMPNGLKTRLFQVDYLNVARLGGSETRVSSGQVTQSARLSARRDNGVEAVHDQDATSGTRVDTRTDVDFWRELTNSLLAIVGAEGGRSVVASPHTGVVVVRATPSELRQVEAFLASMQSNLQRQVVLEAKILEVELSDQYRAGINWAALVESGDDSGVAGHTGGGSIFDEGVSEIAGNEGNLDPRLPDLPVGTDTSAFGGAFTLAIQASKFTAFIELLQTQGDVRTLSSPRISTLNNQKAVIKVGSDEFFVTDVSTTTVTGAATTTSPDITLTPFFSGIALDVTPQIAAGGEIILHVHPSVSEVEDQTKNIAVGEDVVFTLPLAFSTIRESDSIIRARSGQIVVIGGLMQDLQRDDGAGIPLLMKIPYLGRLFRHELDAMRKVELVILLRATVVEEGTWAERLEETAERLEKLSPGARDSLGADWLEPTP